jgi:hypothetical protein
MHRATHAASLTGPEGLCGAMSMAQAYTFSKADGPALTTGFGNRNGIDAHD